jgi:serine/threonine protein kinase
MSTFKNYTIIESLGKGGMAEVYLAEDNRFKTKVAIKVLNHEFSSNSNISQRFIAEARNLFRMSHPNIVRVTDLIEEEGKRAFVMEYIEGNNLRDESDRVKNLSPEVIRTRMTQMLSALGYCHSKGFVHRDIKPSNFMLTAEGQIKLLDFGIAKNTENHSEYTQTGTSQMIGTPLYMSPEQILETKSVDLRSDIYSLGVVLWQLVTGKKPYDSQTLSAFQIQLKIVNEPLAITGSKLDEIIQKCTAKDPKDRFQNCEEITEDLSGLFDSPTETFSEKNKDRLKVASDDSKTKESESSVRIFTPFFWVIISIVIAIVASVVFLISRKSDEISDSPIEKRTAEELQLDSIFENTPGIRKTASGLMYVVKKNGTDVFAKKEDSVKVKYSLNLLNGKYMGSGEFEKNVLGLIDGFIEGCQLVGKGGEIRLFVPSKLAFGSSGSETIPPNSVAIYDVHLLDIFSKNVSIKWEGINAKSEKCYLEKGNDGIWREGPGPEPRFQWREVRSSSDSLFFSSVDRPGYLMVLTKEKWLFKYSNRDLNYLTLAFGTWK